MLILGEDGRLHTKRYFDPWVNYKLLEERLLEAWSKRGFNKQEYFSQIYSDLDEPDAPPIPEKTGRRMTVSQPPFYPLGNWE